MIKIGDYIAEDKTMIAKVLAIQDDVYCLINPHGDIRWGTKDDIDGMQPITLDFHEFDDLEIGDVISIGDGYVKVLVIIGDAVLLSNRADKSAREVLKMLQELKNMSGSKVEIGGTVNLQSVKDAASMSKQHNKAGEWFTKEQLVLHNGHLVRG